MKTTFEEIEKLHTQFKAVENLSWFEWYLNKEEIKRIKKEIKKRFVEIVDNNITKFTS